MPATVSLGISQYLLKPFTYATPLEKLTRHARFKEEAGLAIGQGDVDRVLSALRARRYLEHLVELGVAAREPRYGGVGRPELLYRIPMES
ncbi:hypothetical protein [Nonomuraea deserti]|uniref:hypothetical protein n=1 Tax=Nonomuraea deserti TaxID=1848322 RepID=UPI0015F2C953|nr:hypothetical protein [Nonomuraea deserti]